MEHFFQDCINTYLAAGLDDWEAREMAKIEMKDKHDYFISPEKKPDQFSNDHRLQYLLSDRLRMSDVNDI